MSSQRNANPWKNFALNVSQRLLMRTGTNSSVDETLRIHSVMLAIRQINVKLLPSVTRVLNELSQEHRLAIVTNGAPNAQQQKINAVNLERWVDAIVIAGHDIPPKPDPEPFERAIQLLNATSATTVHVGDSLETYIAGASAAGLDSVWLSDSDNITEYTPTHQIESIVDLLSFPWIEESPSNSG
ncbi:HAD family hydrolase [Haladaptatus pallidirubidus]|nr:HAD-IA family hydrolase [Haladaptatus pallidirubidus]